MRILLIADIHGNFPALLAVEAAARRLVHPAAVDLVINCGDSVVYAPFPLECLDWLAARRAWSVRGNTDAGLLRLMAGNEGGLPKKPDKRRMYDFAAERLAARPDAPAALRALPDREERELAGFRALLCHGSPEDPEEFLFAHTPDARFRELAATLGKAGRRPDIVLCGHSHTPFHKFAGGAHFINPGSAGRMFDGDPRAAFALLDLSSGRPRVGLHRTAYDVESVVRELARQGLPPLYAEMYRQGRKLN